MAAREVPAGCCAVVDRVRGAPPRRAGRRATHRRRLARRGSRARARPARRHPPSPSRSGRATRPSPPSIAPAATPTPTSAFSPRGLILHTDIALFQRAAGGGAAAGVGRSIRLLDTERVASLKRTFQWDAGQRLATALAKRPRGAPVARAWCRAVAALLQHWGDFGAVRLHLNQASDLFPDDPVLTLYRGTLHQAYADARVQSYLARQRRSSSLMPRRYPTRVRGYRRPAARPRRSSRPASSWASPKARCGGPSSWIRRSSKPASGWRTCSARWARLTKAPRSRVMPLRSRCRRSSTTTARWCWDATKHGSAAPRRRRRPSTARRRCSLMRNPPAWRRAQATWPRAAPATHWHPSWRASGPTRRRIRNDPWAWCYRVHEPAGG